LLFAVETPLIDKMDDDTLNYLFQDENLWIFGMIINISGSIAVNFGTNLMKSSHNIASKAEAEGAMESRGESGWRSDVIWRIGMTIFVVGSLVNFASFAFAAQSLLACLGTVQFISNVAFAKLILNETLTLRIIMATCIIMSGLIVAILCSNHTTRVYTTEDLLALFTMKYMFFMIGVLVLLIVAHVTFLMYKKREDDGLPHYPGHKLVTASCYAFVSAVVGTQSVLQSKCLAELLKATIEGDNQFDNIFLYILLLIFVAGLSFWMYRMNMALKMFDGLIIIPLLQVFWTTSAILQGGMYFQEFETLSPGQTAGFFSGVLVVFVGVYFLAPVEITEAILEDDDDGTNGRCDSFELESTHGLGIALSVHGLRPRHHTEHTDGHVKKARSGGSDDSVEAQMSSRGSGRPSLPVQASALESLPKQQVKPLPSIVQEEYSSQLRWSVISDAAKRVLTSEDSPRYSKALDDSQASANTDTLFDASVRSSSGKPV
jgi:hypothetical protein